MDAPFMEVRLAGWYLLKDVDRLIADIEPLVSLPGPRRLAIDLSRLAFIGPTCLAVLSATLRRVQSAGLVAPESLIVSPMPRHTRYYLQRMDLFRLIAGDGAVPEEFERHESVGFMPCAEFDGTNVTDVARTLTQTITEMVQADEDSRRAIHVCLSELAENVIFHADTPSGGLAAAQRFRKRAELEFAIVDLGVGIRASLTKNPAYAHIADDATAIKTALKPMVTATPDRNSGYGLAFTRGLLKGNGGSVLIRSGDAAVYAAAEERAMPCRSAFPGTIVALTARTDHPLRQDDGWNELYAGNPPPDDG